MAGPWGSWRWQLPGHRRWEEDARVVVSRVDQCRWQRDKSSLRVALAAGEEGQALRRAQHHHVAQRRLHVLVLAAEEKVVEALLLALALDLSATIPLAS